MTSSSASSSPPTERSPGDGDATDPGFAPTDALDLCGEVCPFTFIRAKLALEELPIGATLRVIVDHEPAVRNLPRSAREWGQEVLGTAEILAAGHPRWTIDLRKRVR